MPTRFPRLSSASFTEVITQIGYKILAITATDSYNSPLSIEQFLQLAMQTFMISFWHTPCTKFQPFQLLQERLVRAVDELAINDTEHPELVLWALFIGSCSIFRDVGDPWLTSNITRLLKNVGLVTWSHTREVLSRFPWIGFFHDGAAQRLWYASMVN